MSDMSFFDLISYTGYAIEVVGVAIIVFGSAAATLQFGRLYFRSGRGTLLYHAFRRQMGRAMLVGLEFLVAGDVIRTVVVAHTISDMAGLGLVVLIRTILVFTIHLEVEGRWPWQPAPASEEAGGSN